MTTATVPPPGEILSWLGGPIDIRVEVDSGLTGATFGIWDSTQWDEETWGSEEASWADMTPYVLTVDFSAGTQRWGERFDSASASITVDNTTGIFTPDSGVDFWYQPFHPGRRIRIVAIPDASTGVKEALFTGQIDSTSDTYDDAGHAISTTITCSDFMAVFAAHNPLMTVPTGTSSTDDRVHAALDRIGWPEGQRLIQGGFHTMQSSLLAQTTLEECALAADAEGGAFYSDRDGNAVFKARDWLTTDERSITIQGMLGYTELPVDPSQGEWDSDVWDTAQWIGFQGNTAHIVSIETSWEAARIVNHVAFAKVGGTFQEVGDVTSQTAHGLRSYHRTDLENNLNADVLFLAERHLAAFKDSRMRVDAVTITAVEDPWGEDRNRLMWDTRFGDRLSLQIASPWGWSFIKEVHVMAVHHSITADDWLVTFQLDDAQTYEEELTMAEMANVISGNTITSVWGNQIRDRTVQRYATKAARTAAHPTPTVGDLAFLDDSGLVEVYFAGAWVAVAPGEVDGSVEVNGPVSLTAGTSSVATVTLTIPTTWVSWKCSAFATCFSNATGGNTNGLRISIDGTDQMESNIPEDTRASVGGRRTGMTTTGSRSVSLRGREVVGSAGTVSDIYVYARAVRTS